MRDGRTGEEVMMVGESHCAPFRSRLSGGDDHEG